MNAIQRRKCYNAARRARRWVRKKSMSLPYHRDDLGGMCGIAAVRLLKELYREGVRGRIVEGDGHAFVMYKDYILDVTATQFDGPRIVLRKYRPDEPAWWHARNAFRSSKLFMEHQVRTHWSTDQIYMHV